MIKTTSTVTDCASVPGEIDKGTLQGNTQKRERAMMRNEANARQRLESRARSKRTENRSAFTLIEMLVVVSIILVITVAVVAVAPRFTDDRKLSRAADGISQWLLTAKQRSLRDQIPT